MHGVLQRVFDDRLIFPPISSPRRILDCGYGTGHWAMQVALQYPRCQVCFAASMHLAMSATILKLSCTRQVIGVDISSHMTPEEADRPANFEPQMDDLNSRYAAIRLAKAGHGWYGCVLSLRRNPASPSNRTISTSCTVSWSLAASIRTNGRDISPISSESFVAGDGAKWWKYTSMPSPTTGR